MRTCSQRYARTLPAHTFVLLYIIQYCWSTTKKPLQRNECGYNDIMIMNTNVS